MPTAPDRVAPRRPADPGLLTALVALVVLLPLSLAAVATAQPPLAPWTIALLTACFVALHAASLFALRFPVAAFAAASLVMLVLVLAPGARDAAGALHPSCAVYLLCLAQVAVRTPARVSVPALGVGVAGAGLIALLEPAFSDAAVGTGLARLGAFLGLAAGATASWAIGLLLRSRAKRIEELTRARVERARVEERMRISAELHDVVAHAMTVMIAQSEAARLFLQARPEASGQALEIVARTGREALRGMRSIVAAEDGAQPSPPLPATAGLEDLVAAVASPTCDVSLIEAGARRELPPAVALAVHHTVREALTNAVRHTRAPVRIEVAVAWGDPVVVEIVDDGGLGAAGSDLGTGTGLVGLDERVRLAGGTFRAGPRMPRGWAVRAQLPAASVDAAEGVALS